MYVYNIVSINTWLRHKTVGFSDGPFTNPARQICLKVAVLYTEARSEGLLTKAHYRAPLELREGEL